jgi:hypothetical protein
MQSHCVNAFQNEWVQLNARFEAMRSRFEHFMGWTVSHEVYYRQVALLLKAAFREPEFVSVNSVRVALPEWESGVVTVSYDRGRPARYGYFGKMDSGREERLLIRNGPHHESVWTIGTIPFSFALAVLQDLWSSNELPGESYWSVCAFTTIKPS